MLDPVGPEHLIDQQQGIGDDLDLRRPRLEGSFECIDQSRVLGDVVRRRSQESRNLDQFAGVEPEGGAEAGRAGIAAGCPVDVRDGSQDVTVPPWKIRRQPSQKVTSPRRTCCWA